MIHKTAIVDRGATLASDVVVGPYSIIGPDVEIDEGTWVGPHVIINGHTRIGKRNKIYQFSSVGEASQDKKYADEPTRTEIGDDNVIRESVTIHRGTIQDEGVTRLGNNNLVMGCVHIAHDCMIGDNSQFANYAALAGHVKVDDYVILSAYTGVHQFCQIGAHSFLAHACMVSKDVPPYVMVTGSTGGVTVCGLNVEGLKRRGFSPESLKVLRRAYKAVYREGLRLPQAIEALEQLEKSCETVRLMTDFLRVSKRGIVR